MSHVEYENINLFCKKLETQGINTQLITPSPLAPAQLLEIDASGWGKAAEIAQKDSWRWSGVWAEDRATTFSVYNCLERHGQYLILSCHLPVEQAQLPTQSAIYWAANRPERNIQDLFGIRFENHRDNTRWTRHQAWDENTYPLRLGFPAIGYNTQPTPPDKDYPFLKAHGASVYEIPVGPVHAGIIEPGHFRFLAIGETVLHLEERLGYVHKGIEKIAEGRDPAGLARLAGRVSGDTTVGHTWAACLAMERAAGIETPARAAFIRGILAERERVINHLWDLGALCNDVGFGFGFYQFGRLRELWLRENQNLFGHRLLMDSIIPGGVNTDMSTLAAEQIRKSIIYLRQELTELITIVDNNTSLEDRFLAAGLFTTELASALGALGFVGRASGQSFDVRKDIPYAPYTQLQMRVALEEQGDVASRFWVRYKELRISLSLIEEMLDKLPAGELQTIWQTPVTAATGFAAIEGWRGEILCFVRFANNNKICRYWPRDPSVINWPALEKLTLGNIVPDFPVCNKSVNGSYSGHDL
ncbi:NADH-quinone oxidoreductase subunit C [Methylomonas sp. AM2-LC]|uniref:hydrogenase large subunit n=1 Tax=Methylomonas sp. AM2-LC TaxID=3153301 RepID=UPI003263E03D